MIRDGIFGEMVCLKNGVMGSIPLTSVVGGGEMGETSVGGANIVDPEGELVRVAKGMGITFGE
jgi:hypothetical protein